MIKVGDIFTCSWGYDQTNIDFYEAIKVTKAMVWLQQIKAEHVDSDDYGMDRVIPVPGTKFDYWGNHAPVEVIKRKIGTSYDGGVSVRINSYSWARPWNGKFQRQTNSMFGH